MLSVIAGLNCSVISVAATRLAVSWAASSNIRWDVSNPAQKFGAWAVKVDLAGLALYSAVTVSAQDEKSEPKWQTAGGVIAFVDGSRPSLSRLRTCSGRSNRRCKNKDHNECVRSAG
jgi:hypothetical protein